MPNGVDLSSPPDPASVEARLDSYNDSPLMVPPPSPFFARLRRAKNGEGGEEKNDVACQSAVDRHRVGRADKGRVFGLSPRH